MAFPLTVRLTCIRAREIEGTSGDEQVMFEALEDDELQERGGAGVKIMIKGSSGETGLFTEDDEYDFVITAA